nr:VRR-NUC domain-containing protein [Flagellatimonas centrodinii]
MSPLPTEHDEQAALVQWAALQAPSMPGLSMLFAIPNGGHRNKATAGRLRAEGVRAGVPDLMLPVPRGPLHGLFIEMKRRKGGCVSEAQATWLASLDAEGYAVAVCRGWDEAREALLRYLGGRWEGRDADQGA